VRNLLYRQDTNPAADPKLRADNLYARNNDAAYPYILTTYRLTEHHTAGGMSRTLSHLSELQPELFCEISPELAERQGLTHGGWATISTPRAQVEARVLVTSRIPPLTVDGRTVYQVGLPYHWGYSGLVKGDVVNDLLSISQEPNVRIMEAKSLVCRIEPGRLVSRP
jgi:formate dehydrogenase major subunit